MRKVLWDYRTDNNNSILYGTYTITLHDLVENYDKLYFELFSYKPDETSPSYNETVFAEISVNAVQTGVPYKIFVLDTHADRNTTFEMSGTSLTRRDAGGNQTNGLVRIYGISYENSRSKAAGDIIAIGDWFKTTRYSKDVINNFFVYNNTYTPYAIKFVGYKDQRVKIVGQTSQQSYEIVLDSNGEYSNLLFFTAMETLDISIEGVYSHKQAILPSTNVLTINLAKVYHIYKDGQIINNKSVQIDTHTTGRWHPDTGTAAVTNANNELTFNAWPSNTYFRESYIRTGVPVYDGDVAVLKYETNYAATNNESYNPIKNVNSDGELVITFLQPVWDMLDYRNKFQYFGMQWLDQNDAYRPLFLDPDPNNPMLRVQYGIYMYQPGDTSLVSISELTAVVYGVPEVETAI